jgi:YegS/Rv2252/BmrU family lipid kinase
VGVPAADSSGKTTAASAPRDALLLFQPRDEATNRSVGAAIAAMEAGGIRLRREPWPGSEGLADAIRRHAGAVEMVILGGGDGTMNAAAPTLIETGLALGILPLGTANDLARTLGIPPDAEEAARVILGGHRRRIDLGEVNGRPFFNVASIGMTVQVTGLLTDDLKRRWGVLAYAIAAARALPAVRPFRAEIRCGEEVHHVRTLQVAIGNGRYYGGGMVVEQSAELDDGLLHLYSLEFDRPWWLALLLPALRAGRQGTWRQVRTVTCPEVEILTTRPRKVAADGEFVARTPARLRVLRQALSVLAPPPKPDPAQQRG